MTETAIDLPSRRVPHGRQTLSAAARMITRRGRPPTIPVWPGRGRWQVTEPGSAAGIALISAPPG
ncbi:MAG: hypothetical protein AAF317_11420 [Pseudomonadota bacterium]